MFETLFGPEMPLAARFFVAFLVVLGLIGAIAWAVRRFVRGNWTLPLPHWVHWGSLHDFRGLIVSTFEIVCVAFVVIPTIVIALATPFGDHPVSGLILVALTFVVTAFLAGGALTLVTIADNTRETVRILRLISDDVHRMESRQQETRNLEAVSAAVLPQLPEP